VAQCQCHTPWGHNSSAIPLLVGTRVASPQVWAGMGAGGAHTRGAAWLECAQVGVALGPNWWLVALPCPMAACVCVCVGGGGTWAGPEGPELVQAGSCGVQATNKALIATVKNGCNWPLVKEEAGAIKELIIRYNIYNSPSPL